MVDTTERFFPSRATQDAVAMEGKAFDGEFTFSAEPVSPGLMNAYARLAASAPTGPAQRPEWVKAWLRNVNSDCIFVLARHGHERLLRAYFRYGVNRERIDDAFFGEFAFRITVDGA